MKVILFEDVARVGKAGTVVKVADGFFRNYLFPKKMAMEATPGNMKHLERRKKTLEKVSTQEKTEAEVLAGKLAEVTIRVRLKAGENDRLFGSVTPTELVEKLKEAGYDVDRKKIHLPEPIRSLGEFPVEIKLHPEVLAKIAVVVEKDES